MKKYTIEDFDKFEIIDGYINCPSGDYSSIKKFPEKCSFGDECRFGARCSFGEWCVFGAGCSFGAACIFGKRCSFGAWCSFGAGCSFGNGCSFGERCSFGKGCKCEFGEFYHMCACGGFGSCDRTTYFFGLADDGIGVRCGCFAGTIEQWEAKVRETHGDSGIAKAYLGLIEPVRLMMAERRPSNG